MRRFIAILMTLCMVLGMSSVSAWAAEAEGWQTKMMMPTSPYRFDTCVVGDRIFVLSGEKSNLVTIYNTKTDTWKMGTPMPEIPDSTMAVAVGNKVYAICRNTALGGFMQIYDLSTNTWTVEKNMSNLKEGMGVAVIGDNLYMPTWNYLDSTTNMSIYDTVSKTWISSEKKTPIKTAMYAVCTQGTNIYLVGGSDDSRALQVYDSTADTWKVLKSMPTARKYLTAVVVDNKIYAMGGELKGVTNVVEVYDIGQDSWSKGVPMLIERHSFSSEAVNGKIYAIGGKGTSGSLNSIEALQVGNPDSETSNKLSVLLNTTENVQLSTAFDLANNQNFTWSSTNDAVATVDSNGKVTAVSAGDTDIYAENADGTFKEYIPVKVVEGIADELRLAVHLKAGEKAKLYLTDDPSLVTWSSMDESIATVSAEGQVTGVKKGLAIVKAELEGETYQIYVRVNG
ncbi:hypothetical protein Ami103574_04520 [Aminipila butyrica]|uniref:BIG2 domain-containing protein n=1 Tax=Aminipila butyrica TaxID=433296 RepID=A0A858BSS5_9FIRM|nr:Ig-like domain-containing protein [Aminipila butyrica]QIB68627.1 hypothetical protein Ami103574_04520 [Aminipila butyrica]